MSVKGKEKAEGETPVIELDEEEDEPTNFFLKKRRRMPVRPPSPIMKSPEPVHIASDDSDDEDTRKRKRPGRPKKENGVLPAWAWASTQSTRAGKNRGGSADVKKNKAKATETVIVIESSPEQESPKRSKGRDTSLTPPPDLSEERKAQIAQMIRSRHELPPAEVVDDDTPIESSGSRPSNAAVEDAVQVTFRMIASPDRKKNAASQKAIEFYEKKRVVTCGRTQPINYAVKAFASMIRKTPEEIVITFQGRKIFSTLLSPQRIGVDYDGEFVCYEKDHWDDLEKARLQHEADEDEKKEPEAKNYDASSDSEAAEPLDDKVRVTLVDGVEGFTANVGKHVLAKTLVKYFLSKSVHKNGEPADDYRIRVDGEIIEPDTRFEDLDAEEGDQLEIVKI